jgi:Fe-S oxidoreductase
LYDYGFLGLANRYARRVLDELRPEIRAGTPVVGVEPSCVAVFRDDLPKLIPDDEDAKRLSKQTFHFAEFLAEQVEGYEPPKLERRVLVHGHCHARATGGFEPSVQLLERMGADVEVVDSGCCGMAGAWGYEKSHFDVSVACAERTLLPAVRDAAPQTLVVSDGFSCRSQIGQSDAGRGTLHVVQVLQLAHRLGPSGPPGRFPEQAAVRLDAPRRRLRTAALVGGAAAAVGGAAVWRRGR